MLASKYGLQRPFKF